MNSIRTGTRTPTIGALELPAWDLLLLLAARMARDVAVSDGLLTDSNRQAWEAALSASELTGLLEWDRLVKANIMHIRVRRSAVGA